MKEIITFGLEQHEKQCIMANLPNESCKLTVADDFPDILAFPGFIYIINPWELEDEELELLFEFYLEIIDESFETVILTKNTNIPDELNNHFFSYLNFSELETELVSVLERAYERSLEE